jgi:apolipoprotein N-acyltransferase
MCRLRAIEFRTGIVRCCNTGISAIIDPDGSLQTVIEDETGDRKEVAGTAIGRVRLRDEVTLYARYGDVLGKVSLGITVLVLLDALVRGLRGRLARRRCKDGVCEV